MISSQAIFRLQNRKKALRIRVENPLPCLRLKILHRPNFQIQPVGDLLRRVLANVDNRVFRHLESPLPLTAQAYQIRSWFANYIIAYLFSQKATTQSRSPNFCTPWDWRGCTAFVAGGV
jgi:hypothetical protein